MSCSTPVKFSAATECQGEFNLSGSCLDCSCSGRSLGLNDLLSEIVLGSPSPFLQELLSLSHPLLVGRHEVANKGHVSEKWRVLE